MIQVDAARQKLSLLDLAIVSGISVSLLIRYEEQRERAETFLKDRCPKSSHLASVISIIESPRGTFALLFEEVAEVEE